VPAKARAKTNICHTGSRCWNKMCAQWKNKQK